MPTVACSALCAPRGLQGPGLAHAAVVPARLAVDVVLLVVLEVVVAAVVAALLVVVVVEGAGGMCL